MANLSSLQIKMSGEQLGNAIEDLNKIRSANHIIPIAPSTNNYGYSAINVSSSILKDGVYIITGTSRHCGPHKFLKELAAKYKLNIFYVDEESGNNFFHHLEIEEGEITFDKEFPYFSEESIKHNGAEHYIEDLDYIPDNENWEETFKDKIALFNKHGISTETLKKHWEA